MSAMAPTSLALSSRPLDAAPPVVVERIGGGAAAMGAGGSVAAATVAVSGGCCLVATSLCEEEGELTGELGPGDREAVGEGSGAPLV